MSTPLNIGNLLTILHYYQQNSEYSYILRLPQYLQLSLGVVNIRSTLREVYEVIDMKRIEICINSICGRPFQVNEYSIISTSIMRGGRIQCPHCGCAQEGAPNMIFHTHALTAAEEATYPKFFPE